MRSITIGNHSIGPSSRPLMVVEIAPNNDQSLKRALEIIDAAAAAGAQGIKIRTTNPNRIPSACAGTDLDSEAQAAVTIKPNPHSVTAVTPRDWHRPILERCEQHGMICFGSPNDIDSVQFLESLDIPCYKIDAQNNQCIELITKVAATGKPIVVSTGDAELPDLVKCVAAVRNVGSTKLVLMKSSDSDPQATSPANINTLPHMQHLFRCNVGLSDHSRGSSAAIASVAIGASIIEKQLTLARTEDGTDSLRALEPHEFKKLVADTNAAWQALGSVHYGPAQSADQVDRSRTQTSPSAAAESDKTSDEIDNMIPLDNIHSIRPNLEVPSKRTDQH